MKIFILLLGFLFFKPDHCFGLESGKLAPNFSLPGVQAGNKDVSLASFKGKIVVLEWLNHGCPFSRKHYSSGNMQKLQKFSANNGVIWLSIISSAPGKQGHVSKAQGLKEMQSNQSGAKDVLIDEDGKVGRLFEAKTTPHMFVIDKKGILVYQGAIDDRPNLNIEDIAGAKNYVSQALSELLKDQKISIPKTQAYGCSIKYAD
jgi:peroxiredoxin